MKSRILKSMLVATLVSSPAYAVFTDTHSGGAKPTGGWLTMPAIPESVTAQLPDWVKKWIPGVSPGPVAPVETGAKSSASMAPTPAPVAVVPA